MIEKDNALTSEFAQWENAEGHLSIRHGPVAVVSESSKTTASSRAISNPVNHPGLLADATQTK